MNEEFKTFLCSDCGGTVRMLASSGEIREFQTRICIAIPEDMLIPKCDRCGETYFSEEDSKRIDDALYLIYKKI